MAVDKKFYRYDFEKIVAGLTFKRRFEKSFGRL